MKQHPSSVHGVGVLGVVLICTVLAACGGGDDDAATSAPARTDSSVSLDEYAALCGEQGIDLSEEATYGEMSAALGDFIEQLEAVNPPPTVADWHNAALDFQRDLKKVFDDYDGSKDDVIEDDVLFGEVFSLAFEYESRQSDAIGSMSPEARARLAEAGCIDEEFAEDTGGSSDGDGATETPAESGATPTPTAAARPTAAPASSGMTLNEYAVFCAENSADDIAEDVTYGELSEELGASIAIMESIEPPPEVADFHQGTVDYAKAIKALAESQPKDDVANPFLFLILLPQLEGLEETMGRIAPEFLQLLDETGCIDLDEAVSEPPTPTSEPPTPTPIPLPDRPANVTYSVEGATIRVTWDPVDGADSYNVYHDPRFADLCSVRSGGPSFCDEVASGLTTASYAHGDPAYADNYYWVTACNEHGCSEVDSENPARPIVPRAGGPTNVRYAVEGSTIRVTWDAVDGADFYNVYYDDFFDDACRVDSFGPGFCDELALGLTTTSYVHTSPDADENYYWVVACNRGGCSEVASENPASPTQPGTRPVPESTPSADRGALVALYNATAGPNWERNRNWLSEEPIDRWYGVRTDRNAQVTDLDLSGNGLRGELPGEIGSLPSLVELDLSRNQLSGTIPVELGKLSNLTWLDLTRNELTGAIPAEIGGLTSLERLFLRGNQLTGSMPAELGNLSNLGHLRLNHNQLSGGIPAELGRLTNLRILALYSNELNGEIPPELGRLTRLFQLGLSNNRLGGAIPPELGDLSSLRWLYLFGNELSGEIPGTLGALTDLERLQLQGNQLTGPIPPELGRLADLTVLALHMNQLSGEIPASLGALTNLERMFLHENRLSGTIPPELGHLNNLEVLALHANLLHGEISQALATLTNLIAITVCEANQLSCDIASVVGEGVAVGVEAVFGVGGVVGNTAGVVGGVVGDVGGVLGDVVDGIFGGWW